jgi:hypothetical protein
VVRQRSDAAFPRMKFHQKILFPCKEDHIPLYSPDSPERTIFQGEKYQQI